MMILAKGAPGIERAARTADFRIGEIHSPYFPSSLRPFFPPAPLSVIHSVEAEKKNFKNLYLRLNIATCVLFSLYIYKQQQQHRCKR